MSLQDGQLLLRYDVAITCPHCTEEFELQEGFAKKALRQLTQDTQGAVSAIREQVEERAEERARELAGEQAKVAAQELQSVRVLLKQQGDAHTAALAEARKLGEQALSGRLTEMQAALTERDTQLGTLRNEQLELRRERQQLRDEKATLALEVQKQVDAQLLAREHTVRTQERESSTLATAQLQKKLDDAIQQLNEAKLKMEQGSQQLQGEVLELVIEEGLRRAFPIDVVEEVKKGARGGDVLQRVTTRTGQVAGTILWEMKKARDWNPQWVTKLKEDMRASDASLGILVTMPGTVPKEWAEGTYFALHEDIWVTQGATALSVAEVLRAGLLDVHRQRLAAAGKGEKAEALYDYLTSPLFANKLRAIFDTFKRIREELETEKNVTQQRWARRDKALAAGVQELLGIGGEIQGLAQSELPALEMQNE